MQIQPQPETILLSANEMSNRLTAVNETGEELISAWRVPSIISHLNESHAQSRPWKYDSEAYRNFLTAQEGAYNRDQRGYRIFANVFNSHLQSTLFVGGDAAAGDIFGAEFINNFTKDYAFRSLTSDLQERMFIPGQILSDNDINERIMKNNPFFQSDNFGSKDHRLRLVTRTGVMIKHLLLNQQNYPTELYQSHYQKSLLQHQKEFNIQSFKLNNQLQQQIDNNGIFGNAIDLNQMNADDLSSIFNKHMASSTYELYLNNNLKPDNNYQMKQIQRQAQGVIDPHGLNDIIGLRQHVYTQILNKIDRVSILESVKNYFNIFEYRSYQYVKELHDMDNQISIQQWMTNAEYKLQLNPYNPLLNNQEVLKQQINQLTEQQFVNYTDEISTSFIFSYANNRNNMLPYSDEDDPDYRVLTPIQTFVIDQLRLYDWLDHVILPQVYIKSGVPLSPLGVMFNCVLNWGLIQREGSFENIIPAEDMDSVKKYFVTNQNFGTFKKTKDNNEFRFETQNYFNQCLHFIQRQCTNSKQQLTQILYWNNEFLEKVCISLYRNYRMRYPHANMSEMVDDREKLIEFLIPVLQQSICNQIGINSQNADYKYTMASLPPLKNVDSRINQATLFDKKLFGDVCQLTSQYINICYFLTFQDIYTPMYVYVHGSIDRVTRSNKKYGVQFQKTKAFVQARQKIMTIIAKYDGKMSEDLKGYSSMANRHKKSVIIPSNYDVIVMNGFYTYLKIIQSMNVDTEQGPAENLNINSKIILPDLIPIFLQMMYNCHTGYDLQGYSDLFTAITSVVQILLQSEEKFNFMPYRQVSSIYPYTVQTVSYKQGQYQGQYMGDPRRFFSINHSLYDPNAIEKTYMLSQNKVQHLMGQIQTNRALLSTDDYKLSGDQSNVFNQQTTDEIVDQIQNEDKDINFLVVEMMAQQICQRQSKSILNIQYTNGQVFQASKTFDAFEFVSKEQMVEIKKLTGFINQTKMEWQIDIQIGLQIINTLWCMLQQDIKTLSMYDTGDGNQYEMYARNNQYKAIMVLQYTSQEFQDILTNDGLVIRPILDVDNNLIRYLAELYNVSKNIYVGDRYKNLHGNDKSTMIQRMQNMFMQVAEQINKQVMVSIQQVMKQHIEKYVSGSSKGHNVEIGEYKGPLPYHPATYRPDIAAMMQNQDQRTNRQGFRLSNLQLIKTRYGFNGDQQKIQQLDQIRQAVLKQTVETYVAFKKNLEIHTQFLTNLGLTHLPDEDKLEANIQYHQEQEYYAQLYEQQSQNQQNLSERQRQLDQDREHYLPTKKVKTTSNQSEFTVIPFIQQMTCSNGIFQFVPWDAYYLHDRLCNNDYIDLNETLFPVSVVVTLQMKMNCEYWLKLVYIWMKIITDSEVYEKFLTTNFVQMVQQYQNLQSPEAITSYVVQVRHDVLEWFMTNSIEKWLEFMEINNVDNVLYMDSKTFRVFQIGGYFNMDSATAWLAQNTDKKLYNETSGKISYIENSHIMFYTLKGSYHASIPLLRSWCKLINAYVKPDIAKHFRIPESDYTSNLYKQYLIESCKADQKLQKRINEYYNKQSQNGCSLVIQCSDKMFKSANSKNPMPLNNIFIDFETTTADSTGLNLSSDAQQMIPLTCSITVALFYQLDLTTDVYFYDIFQERFCRTDKVQHMDLDTKQEETVKLLNSYCTKVLYYDGKNDLIEDVIQTISTAVNKALEFHLYGYGSAKMPDYKFTPIRITAHNGYKFDFQYISEKLHYLYNIQFTGSMKSMKAANSHFVQFFDTYTLLQCSLKQACSDYDVPEEYRKHDANWKQLQQQLQSVESYLQFKNTKPDAFDRFLEYNRFDTISLAYVYIKFFSYMNKLVVELLRNKFNDEQPDSKSKNAYKFFQQNRRVVYDPFLESMQFTDKIAQLSMEIFKCQLPNNVQLKGESDMNVLKLIQRLSTGGHTFTGYVGEDIKLGDYQDFNSMYPSIMMLNHLPSGKLTHVNYHSAREKCSIFTKQFYNQEVMQLNMGVFIKTVLNDAVTSSKPFMNTEDYKMTYLTLKQFQMYIPEYVHKMIKYSPFKIKKGDGLKVSVLNINENMNGDEQCSVWVEYLIDWIRDIVVLSIKYGRTFQHKVMFEKFLRSEITMKFGGFYFVEQNTNVFNDYMKFMFNERTRNRQINGLQLTIKRCMNSVFGKLMQRAYSSQITINQRQLDQQVEDLQTIQNLGQKEILSAQVLCDIDKSDGSYLLRQQFIKMQRQNNRTIETDNQIGIITFKTSGKNYSKIIGSHAITADFILKTGQYWQFKAMMNCHLENVDVLYGDTDSIMFSKVVETDQNSLLKFNSKAVGDLSSELDEINRGTSTVSISAPKAYQIIDQNGDALFSKQKGINLKQICDGNAALEFTVFQKELLEQGSTKIAQQRWSRNGTSVSISKVLQKLTFSCQRSLIQVAPKLYNCVIYLNIEDYDKDQKRSIEERMKKDFYYN